MLKNILVIGFLILLASCCAFSHLSGYVIDNVTKKTVSGVKVFSGGNHIDSTDEGWFDHDASSFG